jgi:hypothetical protein
MMGSQGRPTMVQSYSLQTHALLHWFQWPPKWWLCEKKPVVAVLPLSLRVVVVLGPIMNPANWGGHYACTGHFTTGFINVW